MKRHEAKERASERCWARIGVLGGDGSCPVLAERAHCRECEVLSIAADQLLARVPAGDPALVLGAPRDDGHRTPVRALPTVGQEARWFSVITFEIGAQFLAIEAARVVEVSTTRTVRRLPHRSGGALLGLVNVQGKLEPCFELAAALGLPAADGAGEPRLLVIGDDARRCAFHVHRPALQEADLDAVGAPPATVSAALDSYVRGILRLADRPWSWLDVDRLVESLERRLA